MSRPARDQVPPAAVPTLDALAANPALADTLPAEVLSELHGHAAKLTADLLVQLVRAATATRDGKGDAAEDRLLTVTEAAQKLGTSEDWLYENADRLPFTVRLSEKQLRFSNIGLRRYIRAGAGRDAAPHERRLYAGRRPNL